MPIPRFRLRTLMVVVAAAALVLGVEVTRRRAERRSAEYRARAAQWQRKAGISASRASVANYRIKAVWHPDPEIVALAERYGRHVEYCRAMKMKYRHAADHPWRPVAPDPPEPK